MTGYISLPAKRGKTTTNGGGKINENMEQTNYTQLTKTWNKATTTTKVTIGQQQRPTTKKSTQSDISNDRPGKENPKTSTFNSSLRQV